MPPSEQTIITVDRYKSFDLARWRFEHLTHMPSTREGLTGHIDLDKLILVEPLWRARQTLDYVRIDGQMFQAIWDNVADHDRVADKLFPQWEMSLRYEWRQCYCDGVYMANDLGMLYVPCFRVVQILYADPYTGAKTLLRELRWFYSSINYDWGINWPAVVLDELW